MTIRAKLWALLVGIAIVIGLMTGFVYFRSGATISGEVDKAGESAALSATHAIDREFDKLASIIDGAATMAEHALDKGSVSTREEMEDLMVTLTKRFGDSGFQDIYTGFEADGSFADGTRFQQDASYDVRKRNWYIDAVTSRKTSITEPYIDKITGKAVISITRAIYDTDKKLLGVIGGDVDITPLADFVANQKILGEGKGFLLTREGIIMAGNHENWLLKVDMTSDSRVHESLRDICRRMVAGETGVGNYTLEGITKRVFFHPTKWGFPLAIHFPMAVISHHVHRLTIPLMIAALLAMIVAGVAILLISRSITGPLDRIVTLARRGGDGDLSFGREDFGVTGKTELGLMADALAAMVESLREAIAGVIDRSENSATRSESLAALSEETNASMEEILSSMEKVATLSESNAAALEETNAGIEEIASGAQAAARAAGQGAEAAESTRSEANHATERVNEMIDQITQVGGKSGETSENISGLVNAVNKISNFVTTITAIADQTNLLALNAAIEAARAGDAGRGFAVVADEVRKLAEESGSAAQEVSELISDLQERAKSSLEITNESGKIVEQTIEGAHLAQKQLNHLLEEVHHITEAVNDIASVAQEQAASSEEMAASIDQITKANMETAEMVDSVRNASEETAGASENVANEAQEVSQSATQIRQLLSRFTISGEKNGLVAVEDRK